MGLVEVGLGKTVSTLTALADMIAADKRKGKIRRALVVAPRRVARDVWPKEVGKWEHLQHLRCDAAIGPAAKRLAILTGSADIVTINYELLTWLCGRFPKGTFPFYHLVLDEMDKMKAVGTNRFAVFRHRCTEFKLRVAMTGTPTPECIGDLWGPSYLVGAYRDEQGILQAPLGTSKEAFDQQYICVNPYTKKRTPRPGALRHVVSRIADMTYVARARDHLKDLPDVLFNDIVFDLPKKVRDQYAKLERDFMLELVNRGWSDDLNDTEEGLVTASNAAVLKNKLRQLCSGFLYHEDEQGVRVTSWLHKEKLDAYKGLRSELMGQQLLVAYGFRAEVAALDFKHRLGGGISDKAERAILDRWDAGDLQTLAMHPASAGHGLNLHESGAHNILFLTLPWSRGLNDQTIGRLHRMNQENCVIVHRLIARDTVEEDVVNALDRKGKVQDAVMEGLKRRA